MSLGGYTYLMPPSRTHAGSLDDPSRFTPEAVTDAIRCLAWDVTDPALPTFEKMPPA